MRRSRPRSRTIVRVSGPAPKRPGHLLHEQPGESGRKTNDSPDDGPDVNPIPINPDPDDPEAAPIPNNSSETR
jgi:hypothetical protein